MKQHFRFDFTFPRSYEVRILEAAPPVHPIEKLYHYPVELEEGDRSGAYVRVTPEQGPAWVGFFALGFDSDQVVNQVCSTPNPERRRPVSEGANSSRRQRPSPSGRWLVCPTDAPG